MWYDLTPDQYAEFLRYSAERSDRSALRIEAENKPWSAGDAHRMRRQARRLRAMALLCDAADAGRVGYVDMRRLNDPTCPRDLEDETVAAIEAEFGGTGPGKDTPDD